MTTDREGQPARSTTFTLEAERVSLDDPLMECLAILAGTYGRRTTAVALSAGLPMHGDTMASPAVFVRAAERVNMTARMVRRSLEDLANGMNLPCILVLKNDHACILRGRSGEGLEVIFPETPESPVVVPFNDLQARYQDYAFYLRPKGQLDGRVGTELVQEDTSWFWGPIWYHRKTYYEVALAAITVNVLALASPLFTMSVYDRVVPNNAFTTLWVMILGISVVYLFDFALKSLRAHFVDVAGHRADNAISGRIFERMLGMKMAERPPSVGVHASHLKEFESLREFFTSATIIALIDLPFIAIFLVCIWMIAGPVALIPAISIPLVLLVAIAMQRPLDRVIKTAMQENIFKSSLIFEILSGIETIKSLAAEGHMQRKWEEMTERTSVTSIKARAISGFGVNFAAYATSMTTVFMIAVGVYQIADNKMTMGAMIAATILSGRAMAPLASIASLLTKYSQSKETLQRLNKLMETPVERPQGQTFASKPLMQGRIEFKDVVFRYPHQGTPALGGISFRVEPGEHVGIIGAVGSGKTTVERLILNLYQPESGSVMVDGIDVRQIDPADLRRNIGVVQQNPYLFYGTVRENITLGHESVPESAVMRAAELAGVMRFLADSPAGLDTQVGERGDYLSGGQRQAIAIARALLYDPPILLMDEPTASIDPGSERRLYEHLVKLTAGKTLILVTHKNSVLGLVDKIVLMDRGRIVQMGAREEIVQNLQAGRYKV